MTCPSKSRGILFNGEMVRAVLSGRKTVTRRIVKMAGDLTASAPYGRAGDRLWCRETWRAEERDGDGLDGVRYRADDSFRAIGDNYASSEAWCAAYANGKHGARWRPSIFMPRWASRITLDVVSVRVEWLHDITREDALAEGCTDKVSCDVLDVFKTLWIDINGIDSWNANPLVWRVEFQRAVSR